LIKLKAAVLLGVINIELEITPYKNYYYCYYKGSTRGSETGFAQYLGLDNTLYTN